MAEKPKNNPEELKQEETINYLKKFGEGDDKNDQKILSNPDSGKIISDSILKNVNKNLKGMNDEKSKQAILNLENELKNYTNGPLDKNKIERLKGVYDRLNNIEAQEIEQDNKSGEEVQKNRQESQQKYKDTLDESVEKIKELIKNNQEKAQKKLEANSETMKIARNQPQETPPDPIENWPQETTNEA